MSEDLNLEDLNEAERLALIVGAAYGNALAERDAARRIAVHLEQDLNEALKHVRELIQVAHTTTWATDTRIAEHAAAFLEAVESPETPD